MISCLPVFATAELPFMKLKSSAPLRDAGPDCGRRWRAVLDGYR